MLPQEIIRRKRDGGVLGADEIARFIARLTDGSIADSQAAAFAMAVFFRGMTRAEMVALTLAMRDSGNVLDWPALGFDRARIVDKHSTGGVGDKVSLVLAPLAAACGVAVPMISGRGLGHTGGTLDKLASIPGYAIACGRETFVRTVRDVGCAIVGPTDDLAPADRRLYAVRDVTATVESLPLIVASILSKKLAAGVGALVLDVKFGSGAFMRDYDAAHALAASLVEVAAGAGVPSIALLTDMNQVLGENVGNALEVAEAQAFLTGEHRDPRLAEVTLALVAEMLVLAGLAADATSARSFALRRLEDGFAAEQWARMVASLGGPADLLQRPTSHLARAPVIAPVEPLRDGFVSAIDARALGLAVVELGGGRTRPDQAIDPAVGLSRVAGLGERMERGAPLCLVHARGETDLARAAERIRAAFVLADVPPAPKMLIVDRAAVACGMPG